jgi:hypothetical protein
VEKTEWRRGGSGCGNGGTFPRTRSRGIERVGPSGSKITRARKKKRPGTSGGRRNQEGEALNQTASVGKGPQTRCIAFGKGSHRRNRAGGDPNPIRLWAVFTRGSAHEPPPENVGSGRDVVGMLDRRRVRAQRLHP